jgi:D-glycero-D-manno-heptose 1,7-bisphosphate phosphatase
VPKADFKTCYFGLEIELEVITKMRRAIFMDRDGTLNHCFPENGTTRPPRNKKEIQIIDGVYDGIGIIDSLALTKIIVSNQPDVERGVIDLNDAEQINQLIANLLQISHSYICFHDGRTLCSCRKPENGLLLKAASDLDIDLDHSYLVGDRMSDVEAGIKSGCTSFLIDRSGRFSENGFTITSSFLEAVQIIKELETCGKVE